ncbi:MAG: hypothetical protein JXA67_18430 [Micromonosporaceae bacterium]|nr:hypothetical protein [Micromonosporaceae bacterium]
MVDQTRPQPGDASDASDDSDVDDTPTVRLETPWVGSASIAPQRAAEPPRIHDTLDLPVGERRALESPPRQPPPYLPPPVMAPPPVPHPPVPQPPVPPPAPPRRRRRRHWGLRFFLFLVLLSCGCCGFVVRQAKPYVEQWPASVTAGAEVTNLARTTDAKRTKRAKTMLKKIESWFDQDSFTIVFVDSDDRSRLVTAFGVTRFVKSPSEEVDNTLAALSADLAITGIHAVRAGQPGGEASCGSGKVEGQQLVVCGWADHGSLGIVMFTNRSESGCVAVMETLRRAIIRRS